ncbi:MAG: hypothetical protein WCJ14_08130 [Verrucomicrobiota bacterium]
MNRAFPSSRISERFASIRFDQAKEDIEPFLKDPREVSLWSPVFFRDLIPLIQIDFSLLARQSGSFDPA